MTANPQRRGEYDALPEEIRALADKNHLLLKDDPKTPVPSLQAPRRAVVGARWCAPKQPLPIKGNPS